MRKIRNYIDDNLIKFVLSKFHQLEEEIHQKLIIFQEELVRKRTYYEEAAYKTINYEKIGSISGGHSDLFDVLERHEMLQRARETEVKASMYELMENLETYYRIWSCYQMLEGDAYEIVTRLYVEGELYAAVEQASGLSHKTFEKRRKQAIKDILRIYPYKNKAVRTMEKIPQKIKKESYEQLSLF